MATTSVLFVCLGNICRSPTAQGVLRNKLIERHLEHRIEIDSAGLGDWHIGNAPDTRAQSATAKRGIDISDLRARQVVESDFDHFDYVIAMDHDNRRALTRIAGAHRAHKVHMLLAFAALGGSDEVPDPYYGGERGFDQVLDLIDAANEGLLAHLLGQPDPVDHG